MFLFHSENPTEWDRLNWQPLDPRQPLTEEKKHRTRDGRAR